MSEQIRITPEQMRERSTQYRNEAEKVGEVISRMDTLLDTLQGEWEGAASRSYSERYAELKPGFIKAQELINDIASSLDATAQIIEETDINIASSFRG